jgi:CPA2 family monovalent cation:H+ antiporter-2
MMVFFLSVGLLIDLNFLWENLTLVLLLWLFVTLFKTALNTGVLRFMGEPWHRAFFCSLILAQIGEFSFVLGAAAIDRQVIDADIHRLIVAVTVVSFITSPLWLNSARRLHHRAAQRPESLGNLLRLIYFREWRLTRRLTSGIASGTMSIANHIRTIFGKAGSRVLGKRRKQEAAKPSEQNEDNSTETTAKNDA